MIDAHTSLAALAAATASLPRFADLVPAVAGLEVTGGSTPTALAAFSLLGVATVLSLLVTYRYARGYLRTGTRPLLFLAAGLFLLTAAPTFIRLAFANVLDAPGAYRTLIASAAELLGLLTILYTIHR